MNDFEQNAKKKADYLAEAVRRLLGKNDYKPSDGSASRAQAGMAFVDARKSVLLVECKRESFYRAAAFRALIGDAILRFQHAAVPDKDKTGLMFAILFDRGSKNAEVDLKEYAEKYAPQLNWLVLADNGESIMRLDGKDQSVVLPPFRKRMESSVNSGSAMLFSPKNQWLWKLLLLPGIDRKYWGGPERSPRSIGELAVVSGVAQSSVSQFAGKAESVGFLRRRADRFAVLNHRELLEDWSYALKHRHSKSANVRPLYGTEAEDKFLARLQAYCGSLPLDAAPVCMGSHLACHLAGVGRSNNRSALLHVNRPMEVVMADLDLVEDDGAAPALRLVKPAFSDGIFKGCVAAQGVPVVDVVQCYLDVRSSPARGMEQADYIYQRVLAPHFAKG